jgi:vacuolar-type H+-ATPase subunit I/STV1
MHFATFAVARDMFYISALLMGLALGFALRILKKGKHRGALITGVLYLFSLAVLFAAFVLILSRGAVLYDRELVRIALCIIGLTAICVYFPIPTAFPAIITAGILIVWTGAVFWRFPREPDSHRTVQTAVRSGDLIPLIGGEIRYLDKEPANSLFFHEEFAILSPAKNRLVFSFVSSREIPSSL